MSTTTDKKDPNELSSLMQEFDDVQDPELKTKLIDEHGAIEKNFIMLHGSDCVWDIDRHKIMKISYLKLSLPESYKTWATNHNRRKVHIDDVIFDPSCTIEGDIINTYNGFSMEPEAGNNKPILDHLLELCDNDFESMDWVLKWVAYPLQNPGAKMASSIVMHGQEGTGKNIFWNAILKIYGKYGVAIGQSQIETEFNAWADNKLFILANEVLSNRERRHIKGRIKALITEDTIMINQKSMPVRDCANYFNVVFLSNETQAVDTDTSDRRFMVIEANAVHSSSYFKDLVSKVDIPSLYHYLLNLDLGEFNQHTKPIMTQAKRDLLSINSRSEVRFIAEWMREETVFPYMDVPAGSLYWAYRCWCEDQGERFPCSQNMFSRSIDKDVLFKGIPNVTPTQSKIRVYFINAIRTLVTRFEFEEFERVLQNEMTRYRFK